MPLVQSFSYSAGCTGFCDEIAPLESGKNALIKSEISLGAPVRGWSRSLSVHQGAASQECQRLRVLERPLDVVLAREECAAELLHQNDTVDTTASSGAAFGYTLKGELCAEVGG